MGPGAALLPQLHRGPCCRPPPPPQWAAVGLGASGRSPSNSRGSWRPSAVQSCGDGRGFAARRTGDKMGALLGVPLGVSQEPTAAPLASHSCPTEAHLSPLDPPESHPMFHWRPAGSRWSSLDAPLKSNRSPWEAMAASGVPPESSWIHAGPSQVPAGLRSPAAHPCPAGAPLDASWVPLQPHSTSCWSHCIRCSTKKPLGVPWAASHQKPGCHLLVRWSHWSSGGPDVSRSPARTAGPAERPAR